jgi:HK97 family phage portal protein
MGLLSSLRLVNDTRPAPESQAQIKAEYHVPVMSQSSWIGEFQQTPISRSAALAVPSVSRCRNIIVNIIAPLEYCIYREIDDVKLESPIWLRQPDFRQPRAATMSATLDSLIFYDVAYWEVIETYTADGRPARFAFVDPTRVTAKLDKSGSEVLAYKVDGAERPQWGNGSLITFQGLNGGGVLARGGRTIQAALDLEKAVALTANNPIPSGIIKNNGADLPEDQISGLLQSWRNARQNKSTAYLTQNLSFEPTQFSPEDLAWNAARQYFATEISRLMNLPAHYLSAEINTSDVYSNIQDERRQLVDISLMGYITAIESRLSMDDICPRGQYVRCEINESFLRSDPMTRLNVLEKMLTLNLITVEQARVMEDLAPSEGEQATYL